ncbi:F0F1 ATP synthase subunit C [Snodgrassella sp. B3882]|uniref:F0F1 ATP synthase subunit C n=1 Tax=Snodgrassella sp. B3882 TaxID=2818037 RepID=UPI00226A7C67|nr:F0F1 ATP synthase subunit C [Snodgrassella sp. B3882]MCX8743996.1 F0F1 ATP synthase subunit C [Snodgrassella sp. B3882]
MGGLIAIACGLMIGISALGSAIGVGLLGAKYMESSARQPELSGSLLIKFFIMAGLVDALFFISVGVSFLYYLKM